MTTSLPPALGQAFRLAAGELGMCSAGRLFVRELYAAGGEELVAEARDQMGREYPVFDFVAEAWLAGRAGVAVDPAPVLEAIAGVARLLVVGVEADFLDALVPAAGATEIGLVTDGAGLEPEWQRVLGNFRGRVEGVGLSDVLSWAGSKSALLAFVYGNDGHVAHVATTWLRVSGPDVRTQFRELVGWDVLGTPMGVYPRWLVDAPSDDFSHLVGS